MNPNWTDVVSAIASSLVPIVVVVTGVVLGRRQSRNDELIRVRLDYYRQLAPDLNRLMCYLTFIGTWRDDSPEDIVRLKRRMDTTFHCAAPLFSPAVYEAYNALLEASFDTFGLWGHDARIRSSAFRRRQGWRGSSSWISAWDSYFSLADHESISANSLAKYRLMYDELLACLVRDIDLSRARVRYTTDRVSLNAHAPRARDVTGS